MSTAAKYALDDVHGVAQNLTDWHRLVDANDGVVTDELEAALLAYVEGVPDKIDAAAGLCKSLDAENDVIRAEEKRLAERRKGNERVRATVALAIGAAMDAAGIKTSKGRFTVSRLAPRKSVEIVDVSALPDDYLIPQPPVADKRAITEALKEGREVPGAEYIEGEPSISIR